LLAVETVLGPPKSFVLARVFDLKEKKEIARKVLVEQKTTGSPTSTPPVFSRAYAYFTAKGEPRIVFDGKLLDGASGKVLSKFDAGAGLVVSRDGKYLVRLTHMQGDKQMSVEVWSLDNER
jgi:hypothetical protein